MSPTLKNIQKCARVLHTLAIIAAVAAFLGRGQCSCRRGRSLALV